MDTSPLDPRAILLRKALMATPGNGLPQSASLSNIFSPPVAVSPATPAPVQPGVQIAAPNPSAVQMTPNGRRILSLANRPAPIATDADADASPDPMNVFDEMRAKHQQELKDVEDNARVDPQQEAVFSQQENDLNETADDLAKYHAHNAWDNLARMGIAMAQSNSPFFSQALAAGLKAGQEGMSQDRYEQLREKALLKQQRTAIAQARVNALQAARQQARQKFMEGEDLTATDVKLLTMTNDYLIKKATSKSAIDQAAAEAKKAKFEADNAPAEFAMKRDLTNAQIGSLGANATESLANAAYISRNKPGGGRGYTQKDIDKSTDDFYNSVTDFNQARNEWTAADRLHKGVAFAKMQAAKEKALIAANSMRRLKGQAPMGLDTLFPSRHPAPAAPAATRAIGAAAPAAPADPLGIR